MARAPVPQEIPRSAAASVVVPLSPDPETSHLLLEALQVGVMLNGPNGEILFVNPTVLDMFGVTKQQVAGKGTSDVNLSVIREDGSECPVSMRPVARAIRSGNPIVGEVLGWRRPGSDGILWTLATAVPRFTDDGTLRDVITTLTDITARKNAEEALRRAGELNREILLSAQEGIIVHDRQLRYVLWNPYMERMSGLKEADVIGRRPLELFPFMSTNGMYADLERALGGEIISSQDAPLVVPTTGQAGWCNNNFAPLRDAKGEIAGVVATVRDITERKHTEEQLRKSEALLSQAEQMADFGSWETDLRTGKSTLSKHLLKVYGLASETDWDRGAYWQRVHPDDRARARAIVERAVAECKPFEFVVRYALPDGTYRVHFTRAIQIPGPDGRPERSIGIAHDITDQVRKEEELRQLSSRLLQLQDEERRRIARDLHDSVSQKLLAISLNLGRLSKSGKLRSEGARHILADTRNEVRGLSREIRSLSYLLHPPLLDELGLASAIEEYVKGFSRRSGINLQVQIAPDVGRLPKESEMAFFRIVQEALGNIQKHSRSSSGEIRLSRNGDEITLEITDAGRGMESDALGNSQGGSETLGVGILGMRERMRQLGGRLEITSGVWGTRVKAVLSQRGEASDVTSHSLGG